MKNRKPRAIKDVIARTLKFYNIPIKQEEVALFKYWEEIVGKQIAMHTIPCIIKNGILVIEVDSPAWRHQLDFMKKTIVDKINSYLQGKVIRGIHLNINTKIASK